MRIWDIEPSKLCQKHLCAQWREGLAIWSILNNPESKSPYLNHPEVKRWKPHANGLFMLWTKLNDTRNEMIRRTYNPKEMPIKPDIDDGYFNTIMTKSIWTWQTTEQQIEILKAKKCLCKVN